MSYTNPDHSPRFRAIVKESSRISPENEDEIRLLTLTVDDDSFSYRQGESIAVMVPGPHEFGNAWHVRRYTIANAPKESGDRRTEFSIVVRRCFLVDEVNGESYPGIASNHLCDAGTGSELTVSGPYPGPFHIPSNTQDNLVMVGSGTGIAPFRAFIEEIHRRHGTWNGRVRLYYGSTSGLDLLYKNDINKDLGQYFTSESFKAIEAVAQRPLDSESDALGSSIRDHADEVWRLLNDPASNLYLAGLTRTAEVFDKVMTEVAGSEQAWRQLKARLTGERRWSELLYS